MHKQKFGGLSIKKGANWVEGVNGPELNPILPLVRELGLRFAKSDYTNVSSNIYNAGYVTQVRSYMHLQYATSCIGITRIVNIECLHWCEPWGRDQQCSVNVRIVCIDLWVCRGLLPPQVGAAGFNLSDAIFSFDSDLGATFTSRRQKDISILTAQRLFGR